MASIPCGRSPGCPMDVQAPGHWLSAGSHLRSCRSECSGQRHRAVSGEGFFGVEAGTQTTARCGPSRLLSLLTHLATQEWFGKGKGHLCYTKGLLLPWVLGLLVLLRGPHPCSQKLWSQRVPYSSAWSSQGLSGCLTMAITSGVWTADHASESFQCPDALLRATIYQAWILAKCFHVI